MTPNTLGAVDAVQRRAATFPVDVASRTALANLRPVITDPAVVVEIGQEAMSLARSTLARANDATAPDLGVDEDNPFNAALRPTDVNGDELFENAFGTNQTNATRESGFFPRAQENTATLESTFPQVRTEQLETQQLQTGQLQTGQLQTGQLQTGQLQTQQLQTQQLQAEQLQAEQLRAEQL
ncbi:MAG TPA: hypothetical protein VMG12_17580, partial [Polyangiaceae bacterium]|nr:hypothetical protein [Polyangiaceae bacterium]